LVLGAWCLVLGAWFFVLGAWFDRSGKSRENRSKSRCVTQNLVPLSRVITKPYDKLAKKLQK